LPGRQTEGVHLPLLDDGNLPVEHVSLDAEVDFALERLDLGRLRKAIDHATDADRIPLVFREDSTAVLLQHLPKGLPADGQLFLRRQCQRLSPPAGSLAARALARQSQVAPGRQTQEPGSQGSAEPAGYERPHSGFLRAGAGLRPVQPVSLRDTAFASGPWPGVGQAGGPPPRGCVVVVRLVPRGPFLPPPGLPDQGSCAAVTIAFRVPQPWRSAPVANRPRRRRGHAMPSEIVGSFIDTGPCDRRLE